MSVAAESDRSRTTLIFTILFLIWACHLGKSQVDQLEVPVCRKQPANNSSSYWNNAKSNSCNALDQLFYRFCDDRNITLETDPVAFVNSKSSVWAYVESPYDNITLYYYRLCSFFPAWQSIFGGSELINCTHNGTELEVDVEWKNAGVTNVSVFIFTANSYDPNDFLGCARTSLIVAENGGLNLDVLVHNDPTSSSIQPAPSPPNTIDPSIPVDIDGVFTSARDDNKTYYTVGNVTFSCMTNRTSDTTYFKYTFGEGMNEPYTNISNFTHTYHEAGLYDFSVDAVAIDPNGVQAFHAALSGQINVLEPVSGVSMRVNSENTFQASVESKVNISAFGTRPILACWYIAPADYILNDTTIPPPPTSMCRQLNNQSIWEPMTFDDVGQYVFVAVFSNNASKASRTISFGVVSSSPKAVVASTSMLIAILAFLIAVVSILMIVMGLYIPYRKYKTKFTETANFKFVELNESTQWDKTKMKVREFADKFNRNRKSSKVGLVNEKSESTRLMHIMPCDTAS